MPGIPLYALTQQSRINQCVLESEKTSKVEVLVGEDEILLQGMTGYSRSLGINCNARGPITVGVNGLGPYLLRGYFHSVCYTIYMVRVGLGLG